MGTSCVRFRAGGDPALDAEARVVASTPSEQYLEIAKAARRRQIAPGARRNIDGG